MVRVTDVLFLYLKCVPLIVFSKVLTTVDRQEEGRVHAVVDKRGLPVQHGGGVNSPIDRVNIQPACWILVNRIPEKKMDVRWHLN